MKLFKNNGNHSKKKLRKSMIRPGGEEIGYGNSKFNVIKGINYIDKCGQLFSLLNGNGYGLDNEFRNIIGLELVKRLGFDLKVHSEILDSYEEYKNKFRKIDFLSNTGNCLLLVNAIIISRKFNISVDDLINHFLELHNQLKIIKWLDQYNYFFVAIELLYLIDFYSEDIIGKLKEVLSLFNSIKYNRFKKIDDISKVLYSLEILILAAKHNIDHKQLFMKFDKYFDDLNLRELPFKRMSHTLIPRVALDIMDLELEGRININRRYFEYRLVLDKIDTNNFDLKTMLTKQILSNTGSNNLSKTQLINESREILCCINNYERFNFKNLCSKDVAYILLSPNNDS